jgi:eukaryotic-like serine/threonine-protein kinase
MLDRAIECEPGGAGPMKDQKSAVGVREGDILAGKYRIEQVLGTGGMGVVVAARHLELDERVAIKFLLPDALDNPEVVARFAREARAAVRIKNEHVARILDVGRLENGVPFIIMEYLEGSDLATLLEQRGALPLEQALDFILQTCEAIAAAHALGIVHRDLKPANLFVVRLGDGSHSIKVLDFGVSKINALAEPVPAITHTSALLGSPLYMPPEQMRSARNADARSDIWSLGILLHELVAGKPPFAGNTMAEVLTEVLEATPPNLAALVPTVPPGLAAVVLRCLEKDPALRYPDVAELASALSPFAPARSKDSAGRVTRVLRGGAEDTPPDGRPSLPSLTELLPVAGTRAAWGGTHPDATTPAKRRWIVASASAGAAAVAVGLLWLWPRAPSTSPAESPSAAWATSATQAPPTATSLPEPVVVPVPSSVTPDSSADAASASARPRAGRPVRNARPAPGNRPASSPAGPSTPAAAKPLHAIDPFEDR